jgi:hemoglobin
MSDSSMCIGTVRSMGDAATTIYDWGGGRDGFTRWLNRFYDLVEDEAVEIAAMFGGRVSEEHREHVTDWWVEDNLGITGEQRLAFVTLLSRAADDVGLPADPEFRAAIMGYAEWGTRLAVHNSQPGAQTVPRAPVPKWGWGVAPPYVPSEDTTT